jgi:hypothetical protein
MSEAVAKVRWLVAAGIRDFQAMLDELGKLQRTTPRRSSTRRAHPRRPGCLIAATVPVESCGRGACGPHWPSGSSLDVWVGSWERGGTWILMSRAPDDSPCC